VASYVDDRIGKTIYADNIKILKLKERRSASLSAQNASLQLLKVDHSHLVSQVDKIDSDKIVTPTEKLVLKREWDALKSLRATTLQKAEEYGVQEQTLYIEYSASYDQLAALMGTILDPLNLDKDTDLTYQPDLSTLFASYYEKATLLDEQMFRYETGMLGGLDYRVKLAVAITATKNPLPLDGSLSTLSVPVIRDGVDVTSEYDSTCFTWERLSEDRTADQTWNDNHASHSKTISVNVDDLVYGYASFICNFYYQYSETMYIAKSGFITLSKEIPGPKGEDAYSVEVTSLNGTVFRMGQPFTTTFEVRVKQGGEDITDLFTDADFRWRRSSSDPYSDTLWNSAHFSTGGKTLTITQSDTAGDSSFFCDLLTKRSI